MQILRAVLFALMTCFLSFALKAQTNLTFGQAIALTYSTTSYYSPVYTVPSGKVWKIESAGASAGYIVIGNINGETLSMSIQNDPNYPATLPVWLPAGTTVIFSNNNTNSYKGFVSILEFNAP